MEAIKGDTLASVYKSLAVLSEHPEQVVVLKTTWDVCRLHGGSRGLQRRLVDVPRTREFGIFSRALQSAQRGDLSMERELLRLGQEATAHLHSMRTDALGFLQSGLDSAKFFTRDEQRQVGSGAHLSAATLAKVIQACVWQSDVLFASHPSVRRLPTRVELPNTYIFRSSLCHLLLILKWAYDGGASKNPDRLRNDMVDTHFASYSTYFDELLSKDRTPTLIAKRARMILGEIIKLIGAR